MKNFLKLIGALILTAFKSITGKSNDVVVEIPQIAISKETLDHVIDTVNNIKNVVANPVTVLITDLIPGTIDNTARQLLEAAVVPVLAGLTYSKSWLNSLDTGAPDAGAILLDDLLNKIRFADDADKDALYHTVAARLIVAASDGKVTWSEAVTIIEPYFKQILKA